MTYDPYRPGIPTLYNGIQFRSRLEAKWAAFFDLLGWEYEYEPFDLNGWTPDFLIKGKPKDILVEVKPVTEFPEDVAAEMLSVCLDYRLLIVGAAIRVKSIGEDDCDIFGWTTVSNDDYWYEAVFDQWGTTKSNPIGFRPGDDNWADCISGADDGWGGGFGLFDMDYVSALWRKAGNLTQWKGKRSVSR